MKPLRWFDPPAVLRLLALMLVGVSRLTMTGWTFHLPIMYGAVIGGLILGLLLGQSRYPARLTFLIAFACGLVFIPWLLGLTMDSQLLWLERALSLLERLNRVIVQLIRQEPVRDSILFLTLMSLLFWALNVQAGYSLVRYASLWPIVLPITLAVLIIQAFDPRHKYGILVLAIYFALLLLVVARLEFLHWRWQWQQERVNVPAEAGSGASQAAFIAAILLVFMAWLAPALSTPLAPAQRTWQTISRPWLVVRDRFSNAFVSLNSSPGASSDYYGQTMSLGVGSRLTSDAVMAVEAPANPPAGVRYYWRAWVYDFYLDGRWQSTASRASTDAKLNVPGFGAKRWEADFVFTPAIPFSTLYAAPQPLAPSRPFNVYANVNGDGTVDLSAFYALTPLAAGDSYMVRSSLSEAAQVELRSAGMDYPEWVTERYLQLPTNITPRTIELAQTIAAPHDNPYDIAEAVTNYLRGNISYAQTIPAPPSEQELVDWFLFDVRQGFCNYYASAEIVLLRSLGIPARMAVGYARGQRSFDVDSDDASVVYQVLQSDAHAWPEVYFPGYGWVEFEPTAAQSAIQRPLGLMASTPTEPTTSPVPTSTPINPPEAVADSPAQAQSETVASFFSGLLSLGSALGVFLLIYIVWRKGLKSKPVPILLDAGLRRVGVTPPEAIQTWAARAALSPLERAYQEVNEALRRLGAKPRLADTPAERAVILSRLLPEASGPIRAIVREYHVTAYSAGDGKAPLAQQAAQVIRRLSRQESTRLMWARLQRRK